MNSFPHSGYEGHTTKLHKTFHSDYRMVKVECPDRGHMPSGFSGDTDGSSDLAVELVPVALAQLLFFSEKRGFVACLLKLQEKPFCKAVSVG